MIKNKIYIFNILIFILKQSDKEIMPQLYQIFNLL
jgi:hypothetical protein